MAWRRPSRKQIAEVVRYFDRYDYPVTREEIELWSTSPLSFPSPELRRGVGGEVMLKNGFYFLKNRSHLIKLRQRREHFSRSKWAIAKQVAARLAKFPTIAAIYVTGALAMNNCPKDDDIDLMIVTSPNTLWITRFFANLYLFKIRRYPHQKTAPDKICPNLWLDIKNLKLKNKNLYLAHEILQAKCVFDRGGIHVLFLRENAWVKKFLPSAYLTLNPSPHFRRGKPQRGEMFFKILNYVFFLLQYVYMLPKMTTEKVGLDFAFFHPRKYLPS